MLFISVAKIGILLLVTQDSSLAETFDATPTTFSSTTMNSSSNDSAKITELNTTKSEKDNTTDNPIEASTESLTEADIKETVVLTNPSDEQYHLGIDEYAKMFDSSPALVEDTFIPPYGYYEGEKEEDKSSDSSSEDQNHVYGELKERKVPNEGENEGEKSSDSKTEDKNYGNSETEKGKSSNGGKNKDDETSSEGNFGDKNHRYGETYESKFSNGQVSYGEKAGFEAGKNLEFGVGFNKATGSRAVGISVGKGTINGHGIGMAFGNDGKYDESSQNANSNEYGARDTPKVTADSEERRIAGVWSDSMPVVKEKIKNDGKAFNDWESDMFNWKLSHSADESYKAFKEFRNQFSRRIEEERWKNIRPLNREQLYSNNRPEINGESRKYAFTVFAAIKIAISISVLLIFLSP